MKTFILTCATLLLLTGNVHAKDDISISKDELVAFSYGFSFGLRYSIALTGRDPGSVDRPEVGQIAKIVFDEVSKCSDIVCVKKMMHDFEQIAVQKAAELQPKKLY